MISFVFLDQSFGLKRHPMPIGYQDIPVVVASLGVSVPLASLVRKCVGALISYENGPFRERHDGGAPVDGVTSALSSGYLRSSGDEYFYSRSEMEKLAVILSVNNSATDGILRVTYYG